MTSPAITTHAITDTTVLVKRSLRHVLRSPDTIITAALTPVAMMLLFVYVFGSAITTGAGNYVDYAPVNRLRTVLTIEVTG